MQARLSIIDLLLIGLDKPAPSLSHFLLGFDLKKQASIGGQGSIARLVKGATFIKSGIKAAAAATAGGSRS